MVCLRGRLGNIGLRGGGEEDGTLLRDDGPRTRRLPAAAFRWTRQDRARGHPPLRGGASTPQSGEEAGYWGLPARGEADGVRLRGRLRGRSETDAGRPAALGGGQEARDQADARTRRDARLRPALQR